MSYTPIRQYDEGETDATIRGTAVMFEAAADTLLPPSSANPFPVGIITGGGGGTQYTEGDTDATITGTVAMWEDTGDAPVPTSAAKPFPVDVLEQVTTTDLEATGTITTMGGAVALGSLTGMGSAVVGITGTWTGEIFFAGSMDGISFDQTIHPYYVEFATSPSSFTTQTNGTFFLPVSGFQAIEAVSLAWTSGTANISIRASSGTSVVHIAGSLPEGFNALGSVTVAATSNPAVNDIINALNDSVSLAADGMATATVDISASLVGTLEFQGATASGSFFAIPARNVATGVIATTTTVIGNFVVPVAGFEQLRVYCTAYTSGSALVRIEMAPGAHAVHLASALPAGTNNIGDVDVLTLPADPLGANADATVAAGATGSISAKLRRATQGLEDLKSLIVLAAGTNNIGDVDVLTVPADPFGANADAAVAAGAAGSIQAKLRRLTQGVEDLKTLTVLAAGTNNIGDVDVLSVVPGTGATNLGKAEDGTPGNGDTAVPILAVRQNTPAASGAADGKWTFPYTDRLGQLRVNSRPDRLVSGHYAVTAFRTLGSAATPQNLFTVENANGSSVLLALQKLTVSATYTAVLVAVEPEAILSRSTALPTGGTALTHGLIDTTETAHASITCRGATASDGGGASAITATAGTYLTRQFVGRIHTAVGEIQSKAEANLLVGVPDRKPFLLRANEAFLVQIVAAAAGSNAATNHYTVDCEFEVFTLP
jgi:hypothetical protein